MSLHLVVDEVILACYSNKVTHGYYGLDLREQEGRRNRVIGLIKMFRDRSRIFKVAILP